MPNNIIDVLGDLKPSTVNRNTRRSQEWLTNKIKKADKSKLTSKPLPGKMYLFRYDPKGKDTLPFYDVNPLIITLWTEGKHFMGLNLHYLPPRLRIVFLNKLMAYATSEKLNERTRMKLTYDLLAGASTLKMFRPTIKKYLFSHVRSKFALIPADQWAMAVSLPLANFKKSSNAAVYKHSRSKF